MSWPYHSYADLIAAGFRCDNRAKCQGKNCGREIEWWVTPKGKKMPLNPDTKEPHFSTCPDAKNFGKKDDLNSRERRMQRGAMS